MKKIAYKLWIGMVVLVLSIMAGIWIFQVYFFPSSYIKKKKNQTIEKAYKLSEKLSDELLYSKTTNNFQTQTQTANEMVLDFENNNLKVVVLDEQDSIIYTSGINRPIELHCKDVAPFLRTNYMISEEINPKSKEFRYVMVGVPIFDKANINGTQFKGSLFLFLAIADLETTTEIIKSQFILITGFLLLGSIIVAAIMSLILTKPISKIEKRAASMAKGDLLTPFVPTTKDEIGRLTQTMENLRESLLQFDKLSKELIANVSHELRTPLAIIRGFAETLQDVTWNKKEKREAQLGAIIEESGRLERVVNDILDYSQLQAGEIKFKKTKINLSEITKTIAKRLKEYTLSKNIDILINVEENIYIVGDKIKIEQVITNLIANAFNHSPENSTIRVVLFVNPKKVATLEISDQGDGISKEELPFIWQRYYQTTARNRSERIGSGLGLAICKIILDAHKAKILVKSTINEGSLFAFEFDAL